MRPPPAHDNRLQVCFTDQLSEQHRVVQAKGTPTAFIAVKSGIAVCRAIQPWCTSTPGGGVRSIQQVLNAEAKFADGQIVAAEEIHGVIAVDLFTRRIREVEGLHALQTQAPVARRPVQPGADFRRAGTVDGKFIPFAISAGFGLDEVKVGSGAPLTVIKEVIDLTFDAINAASVIVKVDGHIGFIDADGFIRQ